MAFNQGLLHISRPLTDLVVSYDPGQDGFVRSKFFPRKAVPHMTDKIRQISKADLLRTYDLKVGSDSKVHEVQFRLDADLTFSAQAYAAQAVISTLEAGNADAEVAYEQRQTMAANLALTNSLEYVSINGTLRSTAVMTVNTTLGSSARWDNYTSTSSDPIGDLITGCQSVRGYTGKDPNSICFSEWTWNAMAQHPAVLARMPVHTNPTGAILTPKILEEILRVAPGTVTVTARSYNSAIQGETAVYKSFLGSDVVVARVEDPSLSDFGLGHEFAYSGFGSDPVSVIKYPDMSRGALGGDVVRVVSIVDFKVTNPTAGYLIKTTLNTSNYGGFVD